MKKVNSIILIIISILTFFILYNDAEFKNLDNITRFEDKLDNSYKLIIPSDVNKQHSKVVLKDIKEVLDKYNANIYYTKLEENTDGSEKYIKYIYFTNPNYLSNLKVSNGRVFSLDENNSDKFLSTDKTGDSKQIGQISVFNKGTHLEIHTLSSLLEKKLFLDGYCNVKLNNGQDINSFIKDLENKLHITGITVSQGFEDETTISSQWFVILALYFLVILVILYDILKSYKNIGIKKMLGFSKTSIWLDKFKTLAFMQIIIQIIVTIVLCLIKFKYYNDYISNFLIELFLIYTIELVILFIATLIPYIYINKIKVSDMIKNKQPTKEIIIFNLIIKSLFIIIFFIILNISFLNFDEIKNAYSTSYGKWEEMSDYAIISSVYDMPTEELFGDKAFDKQEEMYKYFNKKGAILADFSEYSPSTRAIRLKESTYAFESDNVWVNPNYLKINKVYDVNGNEVKISEEETKTLVLVPDKYRNLEKEITEYYKFQNRGSSDPIKQNQQIKLIWIKSNQKLFTYALDINPKQNNTVLDPFINVTTEHNGDYSEFSKVMAYSENPFKMKLDNSMTIDDNIRPELRELGFNQYILDIPRASDAVAVESKQIKDVMKLLVSIMIILVISLVITIIQNIYTYFKNYKTYLSVRHFLGYGLFNTFKEYFVLIFINWLAIIFIIRFFNLMNLKLQVITSVICIFTELLLSLIILIMFNKRNINTILKRR